MIGAREQVPEVVARTYLGVGWPPSSWRLVPYLEADESRRVWRFYFGVLPFVVTWVRPPASCPTCLRPRELPVWETYACPNPVHPGGVWPL